MNLEEYLFKTKQTNKSMAEALQISRTHFQDILAGRRRPSIELAKAIELVTNGKVSKEEALFPDNAAANDDIQNLKGIAFEINEKLISEFHYTDYSEFNKIMIFREACLYRICELTNSALECFISKHHVSAFIICRAVMETESLFWYLFDKIKKYTQKKDLQAINQILNQVLVGARSERLKETYSLPDSINVLKLVKDEFGGKISYYYDHYESLSEFVHPNAMGVSRAYVKIDKENKKAIFSKSGSTIPTHLALPPLIGSLRYFLQSYEESKELAKNLIDLYENQI